MRIPIILVSLTVGAMTAAPSTQLHNVFAADSCLFGRIDDFRSDGEELAQPDAHLIPLLRSYDAPPWLNFDDCRVNQYFAHTAFACLGSDSMSLQLIIRLKGAASQANTDVFYLGTNGQVRWGLRMNAVGALFGAGPTWNAGDTATVVLDLEHLPPSDVAPRYGPPYPAGVTDVLEWVRAHGNLDVFLADDTCVDYLVLTPGPGGTTPTLRRTWGSLKLRYR